MPTGTKAEMEDAVAADETIPETADPAFWDDWLAAVALARAQGFPDEL